MFRMMRVRIYLVVMRASFFAVVAVLSNDS